MPEPRPTEAARPAKKRRTNLDSVVARHPLGVRPKGNALIRESAPTQSLGPYLGLLPDDILMAIVQEIEDPVDLLNLGHTCKALYAYAWFDELWKFMLYSHAASTPPAHWRGSWRRTFWNAQQEDTSIDCSGLVFSDVLYRPFQCSQIDYEALLDSSDLTKSAIPVLDEADITPETFADSLHTAPFIANLANGPIAHWTMDELVENYGDYIFHQEYMSWKLAMYAEYMAGNLDESSLYLFDCKSTALAELDYRTPLEHIFGSKTDFFELLGSRRPDHRWIIIGPERSGSGFHKDPNGTSAWNAPVHGTKYWIMFPPDSPPPGVMTDGALESEVTAPVSVAEWFLSGFYEQAKRQEGFQHGICGPGQAVYVPSGWWHLVVNLTESIAMTGNFVPRPKLPLVFDFFKNKPEQISGFKDDELDCREIYDLFTDLVRGKDEETAEWATEQMQRIIDSRSGKTKWTRLIEDTSFSFGFGEE